jgi:uncharacterized membrane protein YqjE
MRIQTYRLTVLGSMLSSFLVGLHVPTLHQMLEHDATPRWEAFAATLLLLIGAVAGTWTLLHTPRTRSHQT